MKEIELLEMKKKVLIDLSILRHEFCGLGQVAVNYGYFFKKYCANNKDLEINLLLPKKMVGRFGDDVKYIPIRWWSKYFFRFFSQYHVWHSIHQRSRFKPSLKKTKLILTIHDLNFLYEKSPTKQLKYLKTLQKEVDRAYEIICISSFSKKDLVGNINLGNKKVDVIYNGVEEMNTLNSIKPKFITSTKKFFFSIGEVKMKKNFHVLLDLIKLYPDRELYIAGKLGSSYAEHIQERIISENVKNVHLVGLVTNEERVWLYQNCEAFLFPSLVEGFGLPVIEAMSFGKPVFSSKETSLEEIGGDCSFFWDNFNPEHMKHVIDTKLATFHNSAELTHKNISYSKTFSYSKHMKSYLKIYNSLLE